MKRNPQPLFDPAPSSQQINRRGAIKRFSHVFLGTSSAYITWATSYQKPTLKKFLSLDQAAVQASSFSAGGDGGISPGGEGEGTPP